MFYYSGIGSRDTVNHPQVEAKMEYVANLLQHKFVLRSGGCIGADQAFERGVTNGNKEIYLADKGDFGNDSPLYGVSETALKLAERFHPAWHMCREKARKLMARNGYQVLGQNLDKPVEFVICWTRDGCSHHDQRTQKTGGTGQAISIASYIDIPVFNMANKAWEYSFAEFIAKYGIEYVIT